MFVTIVKDDAINSNHWNADIRDLCKYSWIWADTYAWYKLIDVTH
jgi:hypothetical protein